jgi:hypothetical protein
MFMGLQDPHPDPFVRGTDPRIRIRIRIRTNMSRIRYTVNHFNHSLFNCRYVYYLYIFLIYDLSTKLKKKLNVFSC